MATKESKLKNLVVNKGSSSNKDDNEKETRSVWPFPWINLSVPKKKDKKITNDVAFDDSHIDEKQENEKEARIHQSISLDKLSILGPRRNSLFFLLVESSFTVHIESSHTTFQKLASRISSMDVF
nr:hypothetical protein [Tanacetum cinerariifolium]